MRRTLVTFIFAGAAHAAGSDTLMRTRGSGDSRSSEGLMVARVRKHSFVEDRCSLEDRDPMSLVEIPVQNRT